MSFCSHRENMGLRLKLLKQIHFKLFVAQLLQKRCKKQSQVNKIQKLTELFQQILKNQEWPISIDTTLSKHQNEAIRLWLIYLLEIFLFKTNHIDTFWWLHFKNKKRIWFQEQNFCTNGIDSIMSISIDILMGSVIL